MRRIVFSVVIMLAISALQAMGAIYSYRDEHGRLYLTDNPPCDKYKIVVTTRKDCAGPSSPASSVLSFSGSKAKANKVLLHDDETYSKYINEAANYHNINPYLIKSVIKAESDFDATALSSKGAGGLMQLMPGTAKDVGCNDVFNARQNIMGGSAYLKMMLKRFKGKVDLALAAYNAGPGNVTKYKGIPPFRETKNYVKKVKHYYKRYSSGLSRSSKKNSRVIPVIMTDLSRRLKEAYNLFQNEDINGAKEAYRRILNIYPRNTQALFNLACLLDMDRYYEEAIDTYRATLKQDKYLDKAIYNLAVIHERMGMHVDAIKMWKNYIEVTQNEDKIRMAEQYIKELKEYAAIN